MCVFHELAVLCAAATLCSLQMHYVYCMRCSETKLPKENFLYSENSSPKVSINSQKHFKESYLCMNLKKTCKMLFHIHVQTVIVLVTPLKIVFRMIR